MYWAFWKFCIPIMIFLFVFLPCLFFQLNFICAVLSQQSFLLLFSFQISWFPFFPLDPLCLAINTSLPFIAVLPSVVQPFFWPFSESLCLYISSMYIWQGSWPTASTCQRWKLLRCLMRPSSLAQCRQPHAVHTPQPSYSWSRQMLRKGHQGQCSTAHVGRWDS